MPSASARYPPCTRPLNQYHVVMEVAPEFWQNPQTLRDVYVRAPSGSMVPLNAFAHFGPQLAPLTINHQGLFPAVTISFNLQPGVALGDAVNAITQAASKVGLPPTIQTMFAGTAQAYQDSLGNEGILIAAALATVYLVLGILYESYIHPITILSTLPSAGVGALLALHADPHRPERDRHDRHHSADRPGEEERHPDGRFCPGGRAAGRQELARFHFRSLPCCASAPF